MILVLMCLYCVDTVAADDLQVIRDRIVNAKISGGIRYLNFDTTGPNAKKTLDMLTNTYYAETKPAKPFPAIRSDGHITGYDFAFWASKSVPDDVVMKTPDLEIPHPRLGEREFVLRSLAEIAPDKIHPVLKKSMKTLLKEVVGGR